MGCIPPSSTYVLIFQREETGLFSVKECSLNSENFHFYNRRLGNHLLSVCCVLNNFSRVRLFVSLWTVACQDPLSMGFSRQEYRSGFPRPPPGDLPAQGLNLLLLLADGFFITEPPVKPASSLTRVQTQALCIGSMES